jgi:hypothetical protein
MLKVKSIVGALILSASLLSSPQATASEECIWGTTIAIVLGLTVLAVIPLAVSSAAANGASYGYERQCPGPVSLCCDLPSLTPQAPTTAPANATTAPAGPVNCISQNTSEAVCSSNQTLFCEGSDTPTPLVQKSWVTPLQTASIALVSIFGGLSAIVGIAFCYCGSTMAGAYS